MGKSRTLVYQLGRYYKISNTGEIMYDMNWQVIRTQDYTKKNG